MDTDHPAFQQPAPEFQDSPFDILLERIAERWGKVRDLGRQDALIIVRAEAVKIFTRGTDSKKDDSRIRAILAYIDQSATPMLTFDVVCYTCGFLHIANYSMDCLGKKHDISREAFSKHVIKAQQELGISPRNGMRPIHQRAMYREVHIKRICKKHRFKPKTVAA